MGFLELGVFEKQVKEHGNKMTTTSVSCIGLWKCQLEYGEIVVL